MLSMRKKYGRDCRLLLDEAKRVWQGSGNMSTTFINSSEDMQWLRETHLKHAIGCVTGHFQSALIFGNEDCPRIIDLYLEREPIVLDVPFHLVWDGEYYVNTANDNVGA